MQSLFELHSSPGPLLPQRHPPTSVSPASSSDARTPQRVHPLAMGPPG